MTRRSRSSVPAQRLLHSFPGPHAPEEKLQRRAEPAPPKRSSVGAPQSLHLRIQPRFRRVGPAPAAQNSSAILHRARRDSRRRLPSRAKLDGLTVQVLSPRGQGTAHLHWAGQPRAAVPTHALAVLPVYAAHPATRRRPAHPSRLLLVPAQLPLDRACPLPPALTPAKYAASRRRAHAAPQAEHHQDRHTDWHSESRAR